MKLTEREKRAAKSARYFGPLWIGDNGAPSPCAAVALLRGVAKKERARLTGRWYALVGDEKGKRQACEDVARWLGLNPLDLVRTMMRERGRIFSRAQY